MTTSGIPVPHGNLHLAVVAAFPPSRGTLNEYGADLVGVLKRDPRVGKLSVLADAGSAQGLANSVERIENRNFQASQGCSIGSVAGRYVDEIEHARNRKKTRV